MPTTSPGAQRFQTFVARRALIIIVLVAAAAGAAAYFAAHLGLRTAISELLPSDDPGVVALHKTEQRMGSLSLLLIGIHSPDPAANERYAERLTERIKALPPNLAALVAYNVRDVRDFLRSNKWLYLPEDDLESIRDRLRKEIGRRKNPLFVDLGGDDEESLDSMQQRLGKKSTVEDRFPDGLFATKDKTYMWVAVLPPGGIFSEGGGEALYHAVGRLVAEDPPERTHPAMRVNVGGPVATGIATRKSVEDDIKLVTVTCLLVVAASIMIYFRRLRAVPLVGWPAIVGALVALAVAQLAFGYLNSSTAFLGSIIVGNGINYAIVFMSRYEEERARGASAVDAVGEAVNGTWRGTGVAALAASAAYASLMVTSFRGFYQFGVMGAVGALACWLATYTALPAALILIDRGGKNGKSGKAGAAGRRPLALGSLARFLHRRAGVVTVATTAVTVTAIAGMAHFLGDPFEYNFLKLSSEISSTAEQKQFSENVDRLFGRWPSPTIILADRLDEVELIREAIRRQDEARAKVSRRMSFPVIGQITTVWDLLPGTPEVQQRKLDLIASIRKLAHDPALAALSDEDRARLAKVDPPEGLHVLLPRDLPALARRPFTEADGTVGRVVLVYPVEKGLSVWNGRDLLEVASVLQHLHLANGKVLETSGSAVVFGAMLRSILHDGPIATVASLLAVLIIIGATIRPLRAALVAMGTLILGVVVMVGAAGWIGVHVTFLNFIALPITFGIGAEYALNVVTRWREEGDVVKAVTSTGAAVALCSWTTIVGYGSLLAAHNRALQGFGSMAILGEVACLAGAIVALPSFIEAWRRRRDEKRPTRSARSDVPAPPPSNTPPASPSASV
ncbi:MAG TPA: MMPL family transporter [Polyangia bacterium]